RLLARREHIPPAGRHFLLLDLVTKLLERARKKVAHGAFLAGGRVDLHEFARQCYRIHGMKKELRNISDCTVYGIEERDRSGLVSAGRDRWYRRECLASTRRGSAEADRPSRPRGKAAPMSGRESLSPG